MRIVTMIALFALAAMSLAAAEIDGAWKASMPGRDGATMEMTFTFKAKGAELTGTLSTAMGDTAISDGKVAGNKISFTVKREMGDRTFVMKYTGEISGDDLKMTSVMEGSERPPREFTAKRVK